MRDQCVPGLVDSWYQIMVSVCTLICCLCTCVYIYIVDCYQPFLTLYSR